MDKAQIQNNQEEEDHVQGSKIKKQQTLCKFKYFQMYLVIELFLFKKSINKTICNPSKY
jgi:hypothetical protein